MLFTFWIVLLLIIAIGTIISTQLHTLYKKGHLN
jgi:hypothetical protein